MGIGVAVVCPCLLLPRGCPDDDAAMAEAATEAPGAAAMTAEAEKGGVDVDAAEAEAAAAAVRAAAAPNACPRGCSSAAPRNKHDSRRLSHQPVGGVGEQRARRRFQSDHGRQFGDLRRMCGWPGHGASSSASGIFISDEPIKAMRKQTTKAATGLTPASAGASNTGMSCRIGSMSAGVTIAASSERAGRELRSGRSGASGADGRNAAGERRMVSMASDEFDDGEGSGALRATAKAAAAAISDERRDEPRSTHRLRDRVKV